MNKVQQIAKQLKADLSKEALLRYKAEQEKNIENALKYGRKPGIYVTYLKAVNIALGA